LKISFILSFLDERTRLLYQILPHVTRWLRIFSSIAPIHYYLAYDFSGNDKQCRVSIGL